MKRLAHFINILNDYIEVQGLKFWMGEDYTRGLMKLTLELNNNIGEVYFSPYDIETSKDLGPIYEKIIEKIRELEEKNNE